MKSGIFLLCLGLYLIFKTPFAFVMAWSRNLPYSDIGVNLILGFILGLVLGSIPLYFGIKRIRKARHPQGTTLIDPKRVADFLKENCRGCRFVDPKTMQQNQQWCTRPEPPEYDSQYCYSRELKVE